MFGDRIWKISFLDDINIEDYLDSLLTLSVKTRVEKKHYSSEQY